ncbi:SPOR domain-containing protein [Candidatus Rhodobacter oscarellae]|nr:SPOR domain-containing protein [Candidatus Rhodobacter lobularis]
MADFAEIDAGGVPFGEADDGAGLISMLLSWVGALLSVALVIGLAVWGYQLAMRDVSGVPVVRALEGPMRIAPEDPGGYQAAHQGLAVNSVAAEGGAAAPPERLVLAPAPLDLTQEDLPRPQLAEVEIVDAEVDTAGDVAPLVRPSREELQAMAEELASGVTPLAGTLTPVISPDVPGVKRSLVPRPRPAIADLTAEAVASSVAIASARPTVEVEPSRVPAGTRLVQFGAYDSPDAAREAWDVLLARFADFMRGKSRVVQEAVSGGKTFYRLRAMGFADISEARRFCAAMEADRQACIPVVVR